MPDNKHNINYNIPSLRFRSRQLAKALQPLGVTCVSLASPPAGITLTMLLPRVLQ
jgi:hypothetical protein